MHPSIGCGVKGGDVVRLRRGRRQARVWKGGRARRGNLGAIAEDAVAAHAYVIRGGRPGEIDLRGGDGAGREARVGGAVRSIRGGGARVARPRREISCSVKGGGGVGIRRGWRQACVGKGG